MLYRRKFFLELGLCRGDDAREGGVNATKQRVRRRYGDAILIRRRAAPVRLERPDVRMNSPPFAP